MKKSILTSTLIAAVALATPVFAAEGLLPELSSATRISGSYSNWSNLIGNPTGITADAVGGNYASGAFSNGTGWYWGLANLSSDAGYDSDFSISSGTSFTYAGRYNYGGEYVAAVVKLSGLLSTDELLSGFSISFTMTTTAGGANDGFHIYYVNTETYEAVEFTSESYTGSGAETHEYSYTWEASSEDEYLSGDYALVFVWNSNASGGAGVSVTGLTSDYTITTLPEPSMFGLMFGLGAIGLVATRRRRR